MDSKDGVVVTIGDHIVPSKSIAVKYPFKWRVNNKTATAAQIRAEWDLVTSLALVFPGFYDSRDYAQLYLTDEDLDMVKLKYPAPSEDNT